MMQLCWLFKMPCPLLAIWHNFGASTLETYKFLFWPAPLKITQTSYSKDWHINFSATFYATVHRLEIFLQQMEVNTVCFLRKARTDIIPAPLPRTFSSQPIKMELSPSDTLFSYPRTFRCKKQNLISRFHQCSILFLFLDCVPSHHALKPGVISIMYFSYW